MYKKQKWILNRGYFRTPLSWGEYPQTLCAGKILGMPLQNGFTLIELLVVVLIIGILSAVALPQYRKVVEKARATDAITLLRALGQAEQVYKLATGEYTLLLDDLDIEAPGIKSGESVVAGRNYATTIQYALASASVARVQANRNGKDLWFIYYLNSAEIHCQIHKSSAENSVERDICKTFSSAKTTCPESTYDCYAVK